MKKLAWSAVLLTIAFTAAIMMVTRLRVVNYEHSTIAVGMRLGDAIVELGTPDHIEDRDYYYWVCWKNGEVLSVRLDPFMTVTTVMDHDAVEINVKPWRGFQTEVK